VKPNWIYEAVRAGRLPCLRLGRHIRFTRSMLEQLAGGESGRLRRWRVAQMDAIKRYGV